MAGFQRCSCCGQAGRKITGCSCKKLTGFTHVCLREAADADCQNSKNMLAGKVRASIRKWNLFTVKLLVDLADRAEKTIRKTIRKWSLFTLHLVDRADRADVSAEDRDDPIVLGPWV